MTDQTTYLSRNKFLNNPAIRIYYGISETIEKAFLSNKAGCFIAKSTLWNDLAVGDDRQQLEYIDYAIRLEASPEYAGPAPGGWAELSDKKKAALQEIEPLRVAAQAFKEDAKEMYEDLPEDILDVLKSQTDAVLDVLGVHKASMPSWQRFLWYVLFAAATSGRLFVAIEALPKLGKGSLIAREGGLLMRVISEPKTLLLGPFVNARGAFRQAEDKVLYGTFNTLAVLVALLYPQLAADHKAAFTWGPAGIAVAGFVTAKVVINGSKYRRHHLLRKHEAKIKSGEIVLSPGTYDKLADLEWQLTRTISAEKTIQADARASHGAKAAHRDTNLTLSEMLRAVTASAGSSIKKENKDVVEKAGLSITMIPFIAVYLAGGAKDQTLAVFAALIAMHNAERSIEDLTNPEITGEDAEATFGTNVSNIMAQVALVIIPILNDPSSFSNPTQRNIIMGTMLLLYATVIHKVGKPATWLTRKITGTRAGASAAVVMSDQERSFVQELADAEGLSVDRYVAKIDAIIGEAMTMFGAGDGDEVPREFMVKSRHEEAALIKALEEVQLEGVEGGDSEGERLLYVAAYHDA